MLEMQKDTRKISIENDPYSDAKIERNNGTINYYKIKMYNTTLPKRIAFRNNKTDVINIPSFNLSYIDNESIANDYLNQAHSWAQSRKPSIGNCRSACTSIQLHPFKQRKFKESILKANSTLQSTQNTITILKEMLRRLDKKPLKSIYSQTTQLANIAKVCTNVPVKCKYDNLFNKYSHPLKSIGIGRNKQRAYSNLNNKLIAEDGNSIFSKITVTRKKRMSGFEESLSFDAKKIVDQYKETQPYVTVVPLTSFTNPQISFTKYKRSCISINSHT